MVGCLHLPWKFNLERGSCSCAAQQNGCQTLIIVPRMRHTLDQLWSISQLHESGVLVTCKLVLLQGVQCTPRAATSGMPMPYPVQPQHCNIGYHEAHRSNAAEGVADGAVPEAQDRKGLECPIQHCTFMANKVGLRVQLPRRLAWSRLTGRHHRPATRKAHGHLPLGLGSCIDDGCAAHRRAQAIQAPCQACQRRQPPIIWTARPHPRWLYRKEGLIGRDNMPGKATASVCCWQPTKKKGE